MQTRELHPFSLGTRSISRRNLMRGSGAIALGLALPSVRTSSSFAQADQATIVASGLINPKAFTWGSDGTLYVAEADQTPPPMAPPAVSTPESGSSGATAGAQPTLPGIGTTHAGAHTGQIVKIVDGCPSLVAGGFPSVTNPDIGWAFGVSAVAFLDDQLYALVDGGGASTENADLPNGLYKVAADGTFTIVADLSAWIQANEVAQPHEPLSPDGEPFGMIAGTDALYVTESNHEQLLKITPDGTVTRLVDFSPLGDTVPTGIVADPAGGFYIGFLSPLPFADGTSKVMKVAADGTATDVWTNLSAVTGIALGPDGTLYAAELTSGAGSGQTPPFVVQGAGKVVRQTGPSTSEDVATGLSSPTWLAFGPDGGLYVDGPGIGSFHGEGMIFRIDPAATQSVDLANIKPAAACSTAFRIGSAPVA